MSQIFISYAKEDVERARALAELLTQHGWSVFWDNRIPPGKSWHEVIEAKLKAAACVVVIWTRASVTSRWVRTEAEHGLNRRVLIPVVFDQVEVPFGFGFVQYTNLTEWDQRTVTPDVEELIEAITLLIGESDAGSASHPTLTSAEPIIAATKTTARERPIARLPEHSATKVAPSRRTAVWAMVTFAAVVAMVGLGWWLRFEAPQLEARPGHAPESPPDLAHYSNAHLGHDGYFKTAIDEDRRALETAEGARKAEHEPAASPASSAAKASVSPVATPSSSPALKKASMPRPTKRQAANE